MRLSQQRHNAVCSMWTLFVLGGAVCLAAAFSADAAEPRQRLIVSPSTLRIVTVEPGADAPTPRPWATAQVKRLPKPPTAAEVPSQPGKVVRLALEVPAVEQPAAPLSRGVAADRIVPTSLEIAMPKSPTPSPQGNVLRKGTANTSAVLSTGPLFRPPTSDPSRQEAVSSGGTQLRIRGR